MKLFDQNRNYVLGDEELDLIGERDKLAQWRHKGMGPALKEPLNPLLNPHFGKDAESCGNTMQKTSG
ncbi:hypothetical protein NBRC116596_09040 [Litorivita sp. NS0012-18]